MNTNIILKKLSLTNFKGIRSGDYGFGLTTNIFGANAAGKSTVMDAFIWLLTGKDSLDRKDHEIKTVNEKNEVLHRLDHEVEGVFDIDGSEVVVKRTYREKWQKKRGATKEDMTGHETVFEWNGVPKSESEFNVKVAGLCDLKVLKLITNPYYFNSLDWKVRREELMKMAGDVTDASIAAGNPAFKSLLATLIKDKLTMDEYKKQLGAKKRTIREEKDLIPARIDEANRSLPEAEDYASIETRISTLQAEINSIDAQILALSNDSAGDWLKHQRQQDLHQLKVNRDNIKVQVENQFTKEHNEAQTAITNKQAEVNSANALLHEKNSALDYIKGKIKRRETVIEQRAALDNQANSDKQSLDLLKSKVEESRAQWKAINAEQYVESDDECTCPTCKQMLIGDNLSNKKAELKANWDKDKERRLNAVVDTSNVIKKEISMLENQINLTTVDINRLSDELESIPTDLQEKLEHLTQEAASLVTSKANVSNELEALKLANKVTPVAERLHANTNYQAILQQIVSLESEEDKKDETAINDLTLSKGSKQSEVTTLNEQLATKGQREKILARIIDLQESESTMAQGIADIEKIEDAILAFDKAKMDSVESCINDKFKLVSFKMFDRQVNGQEIPACETLLNGVPWSVLNTAAKIAAGIDIINAFTAHYKVSAPIFLDNRESVTNIPETESQVVNLIVSPKDKALHIEATKSLAEAV